MKPKKLEFQLFSGGTISIQRDQCLQCETKACVRNCVSSSLEPVLIIQEGLPELSRTDIPTESGWCIECTACELDCSVHGRNAIRITFPQEESI